MPASTGTSGSTTPIAGAVTTLRVESTGAYTQQSVPLTFGQVFAPGDMPASSSLVGKLSNGTLLPVQLDAKATHPDGSIRHGIVSVVMPQVAVASTQAIGLTKSTVGSQPSSVSPLQLTNAGFTASVRVNIGGQIYTAAADDLLKSGRYSTWLSGPIVNEWLVSAPLKSAAGVPHPHLSARFAIRSYTGLNKVRVDVTVENDWAYEPNPQNFTYDATVLVGGQTVYSKAALTHYHHARWRKIFWWGDNAPQVNIKHDTAYLIASKALPNYDQSVAVSPTSLSSMQANWTGAKTEPMGSGMAVPYMPTTGGRPDIGILPGWAAMYLLSMDKRAKDVTLATADLAGSWSSHYRDKNTDRPVSLLNYPYMTILGHYGDTYNPVTKKYEAFPACAAGASCTNPNVHDSSHQPGFAYLPYLVTGDYYYLEELQFWAMWNTFEDNPGYRDNIKGLFKPDQVRGQAWSMRTMAQAAYITPDTDPLKQQFETFLANNLDWYNANYTSNSSANNLGFITNGYAIVYNNGTGVAPWQDDFFTAAIGVGADLGYAKAKSLLGWKSKFPIGRMVAPGYCWIDGAIYNLTIRDSSTSPIYSTFAQAYQASHTASFNALPCGGPEMAAALGLRTGEMTGYSSSGTGYPSNMQPALAYSADLGTADGANAWKVFMNRSVKPDYTVGPQFAIVPRRSF
jgi:hypothetical protein